MVSLNTPIGHPAIPLNVAPDEIWVIVTTHHPLAQHANRGTPHITTIRRDGNGIPNGNHVFLRRIIPHLCFYLGRDIARDSVVGGRSLLQDVYLPGASVGLQQCVLIPDWERNIWRLESRTKTIAIVNGTPIQDYTARTKRMPNPLPNFVYLKQSEVNTVMINSMQVDIWLMKSVREAYQAHELPPALLNGIRYVSHTPQSDVDRYYLTREQVSAKSYRVVERFTGETFTAKLFQSGEDPQQLRDRDFLTLSKQDVDASIVRYQQTVEIEAIPAIITDSHYDYMSYAGLGGDIKKSHPGIRFSIATKLVRRLFSALAWMHFNGIIHGSVSSENVLLRLTDKKIAHVLLVDYTTARSVLVEQSEPMSDMIADGRSAMQLIEDCCDIWAFRNGPTLTAMGEDLMQKHAQDALHKYQVVQRVHTDFYNTDRNSHESEKGIKIDRLLNKLASEWHSARDKQAQNRAEREVANMSKSKIEAKAQEWESANGTQAGVYKQYMILSLGHSYLDSLADPFHFGRWDIKPSEICAKIRELGGELEEPWQTFEVCLTTPLVHGAGGFSAENIMNWLAACCEVFPEWRKVLDLECQSHLRPNGVGVIPANDLHNLRVALQAHGELPPSMSVVFNNIPHEMATPQQVEESFQVWYHIPSRMFNLTQLQRLATPSRLAATISEGQIRCNNFVEVRGDPKVQGNYAPLALLEAFVEQLGLRLAQTPNLLSTIPSFDPSDFSQVPSGRIVLARPGLIGYGSMLRSGDQASFLYSRTNSKFIMPSAFIPTYFGDMKVLPTLPNNRNYDRPDHWSKFRTSEAHEASANLDKRRKLVALGPKANKLWHGRANSPALSDIMEVDDSTLVQMLEERERVRSEARPPATRNAGEISSATATVDPKRARPEDEDAGLSAPKIRLPDISMSFIQRMEERNQAPSSGRPMPGHPTVPQISETSFGNMSFIKRNLHDPNQSFTVVDDDEGLQEDWAEVDRMLAKMPAEDEEPEVQGLTGYIFHDFPDDDGPATNPPSFTGKGKGKATAEPQAFFDAQSQNQRGGFSFSKSLRQSPKKMQDSPATSFMKKHRRNMSGLSNVTHSSDIMPATQPSSPTPQAPPHTTPGQTDGIGKANFGSGMVRGFLTQASTRPGSAARPIPFGNPATRPPTFPAQIMNPNTSFSTSMPDTDPGMSFGDNMPPTQANGPHGAPHIGNDFPNVNMSSRTNMPPTEANSPTAPANHVPNIGDNFHTNTSFGSDIPPTESSSPTGAPNLDHVFNMHRSYGSDMPPTRPNSPVGPLNNTCMSFDSKLPPTQPSALGQNDAFKSRPGGSSDFWVMFRSGTQGGDEDMPDTDGEDNGE